MYSNYFTFGQRMIGRIPRIYIGSLYVCLTTYYIAYLYFFEVVVELTVRRHRYAGQVVHGSGLQLLFLFAGGVFEVRKIAEPETREMLWQIKQIKT